MPLDLKETRLPGVGVKFSLTTVKGARLTVIQHNDGTREVYVFPRPDDDEPRAVIKLLDEEARQFGAVVGGAYESPKLIGDPALALRELTIEWVPVPEDSPAIGHTLAECGFRARTGITIIAILREPEPVAGAQPDDVIERGDTLVTVGKAGAYRAFLKLLASGDSAVQGESM
jgi:TrkA domain protein